MDSGVGAIEQSVVFDPRKRTKTFATRHIFWADKKLLRGPGSASNPAGKVTALPRLLADWGPLRGGGKKENERERNRRGRKGKEKEKKKRAESSE